MAAKENEISQWDGDTPPEGLACCAHCAAFVLEKSPKIIKVGADKTGHCHRFPPHASSMFTPSGPGVGTAFPQVSMRTWCMMFVRKTVQAGEQNGNKRETPEGLES